MPHKQKPIWKYKGNLLEDHSRRNVVHRPDRSWMEHSSLHSARELTSTTLLLSTAVICRSFVDLANAVDVFSTSKSPRGSSSSYSKIRVNVKRAHGQVYDRQVSDVMGWGSINDVNVPSNALVDCFLENECAFSVLLPLFLFVDPENITTSTA